VATLGIALRLNRIGFRHLWQEAAGGRPTRLWPCTNGLSLLCFQHSADGRCWSGVDGNPLLRASLMNSNVISAGFSGFGGGACHRAASFPCRCSRPMSARHSFMPRLALLSSLASHWFKALSFALGDLDDRPNSLPTTVLRGIPETCGVHCCLPGKKREANFPNLLRARWLAALAVLIGLVHAVLGEILIFSRLRRATWVLIGTRGRHPVGSDWPA